MTTVYSTTKRFGRIPVAEVRGDVLYKTIKSASWEMRKPPGIAFDVDSLEQATQAGAKFVCITAPYKRREPYWARIDAITIPIDRENNFQRGLSWLGWRDSRAEAETYATERKTRHSRPVAPADPQQNLFP